jgi:hypothetical protein
MIKGDHIKQNTNWYHYACWFIRFFGIIFYFFWPALDTMRGGGFIPCVSKLKIIDKRKLSSDFFFIYIYIYSDILTSSWCKIH